jgi:hypothetical protein
MFRPALLLVCAAASVAAGAPPSPASYNATIIAISFDIDQFAPPPALGHILLDGSPSSKLITDISDYQNYVFVLGVGLVAPWTYFVVTAEDETAYGDVYNISSGLHYGPTPLQGISPSEIHCDPGTGLCYAIALDKMVVVEFAPLQHTGTHRVVVTIPKHWVGLEEDSSALDTQNNILYATMTGGSQDLPSLLAFNLRTGTTAAVAGRFAQTSSGPYCFDPLLGLVSLGSSLGGIVAMNTTDGSVRVLRQAGLVGIPGDTSVACRNGILAVGVVDFLMKGSPYMLQAYDLLASDQPFHNSSTVPDGLRGLVFADTPQRL